MPEDKMYIGPRCDECDQPGLEENDYGEILCQSCLDNRAEAAWKRHCSDFHDGGSIQPWNDGQPPKRRKDYIK